MPASTRAFFYTVFATEKKHQALGTSYHTLVKSTIILLLMNLLSR